MDVTIVRPKRSGKELVSMLVGAVAGSLLNAWFLMLLLGALTNWGFSYWYTVGVIYAIAIATSKNSGWRIWTKEAK